MAKVFKIDLAAISTGMLTAVHDVEEGTIVGPADDYSGSELPTKFTWAGSLVGTGLPNNITHAEIAGEDHDRNVLSAAVPSGDVGSTTKLGRLAKSKVLYIDPVLACAHVQAGTPAFSYKWENDKADYPFYLSRLTPLYSMAYGTPPRSESEVVDTTGENLRPFLGFQACGGNEYGTMQPFNAPEGALGTPGRWFADDDCDLSLSYKHGDCYKESWYGAIFDFGLRVSLNTKNLVIGDTESTPAGHRYFYGYAKISVNSDTTHVSNFDALVGRYNHAGDLTGTQRQGNDETWMGFFNHYNPYSHIWYDLKHAEASWSYWLNMYGEMLAVVSGLATFVSIGSWTMDTIGAGFSDKRIRSSIRAEHANGDRDSDINIITHAGLGAHVWPSIVPNKSTGNNAFGSLYLANARYSSSPTAVRALTVARVLATRFLGCTRLWRVQRADLAAPCGDIATWLFSEGKIASCQAAELAQSPIANAVASRYTAFGGGITVPFCVNGESTFLFRTYQEMSFFVSGSSSGYHAITFYGRKPVATETYDDDAYTTLSPYTARYALKSISIEDALPLEVSVRSWGGSTAPVQKRTKDRSANLRFTRAPCATYQQEFAHRLGRVTECPDYGQSSSFLTQLLEQFDAITLGGQALRWSDTVQSFANTSHFWELAGNVPGVWLGKNIWASDPELPSGPANALVVYGFTKSVAPGFQVGGKF